MAIIPRYTSRALPPGAQPGLTASAMRRGEAGAGLAAAFGDTIVAGIDYKKRKDAARAGEKAYRTQTLKDLKEGTDGLGDGIEGFDPFGEPDNRPLPDGWTVGFGDATLSGGASAAGGTGGGMAMRTGRQKQVRAALDRQSDETLLASFETAMTQARAAAQAAAAKPGAPARDLARLALAQFDRDVARLSEELKNRPHLKSRFDALAVSSRAPMELRMLTAENARRADEEKAVLSESLAGLALAAAVDPAMAPGVTGRGFAQIEAAMKAGMLAPEEAAAMQGAFGENVHMSAMRGQIAADPAQALAKLETGEFDDVFAPAARDMLAGEARTTARVRAAGASAAARARRRGLELDMADHLAALDETGVADEAVAARARAELPADEYAAFRAGQARARERHATRAEYAFMTAAEIEADIAQRAEGGPANIDRRDGDQHAAAHAIRTAIRDEVLAARAADPAGWAMRDDDLAAAFAAAQEDPDDLVLARKAIQQRLALQREMGIAAPRLLSDAERDDIAGALARATPADRPAIIAGLRERYGPQANMLAAELIGEVDANTALLIAHAEIPHLPRLLAQGMEKARQDGPTKLTLASPEALDDLPALPIIDKGGPAGRKLDMAAMKPGQHYRAAGGGVLRYDGEALVPVELEGANPVDANAPTPQLRLGGHRWQPTVPDVADQSPLVKVGMGGDAINTDKPDEKVVAGEGTDDDGPVDLEEADSRIPYGPEDEETELEPAGEFEGFTRKKQQVLNGMFIIAKVDEIKKAEAARRGERADLLETPRQQEQDETAPPIGEPGFADMTEEEWSAHKLGLKARLGKRVESFSRNYRELAKEFDSVNFFDDPEYGTLRALGDAGEKAIEKAPGIPDQYRLLALTLREYGVDPGDPEAVMEALYDDEFRGLLDERINEWIGNTLANETVLKPVGYEGGKPQPVEGDKERVRPQGAKAQWRRIEDRLVNAGYGTAVGNVMMEVFTLRSIEEGVRPDQLMPPRLAEQHQDRLPGDETALDRYAASLEDERAAMKAQFDKEIVDRLAAALEKQGKARARLKASKAQPGVIDDPLAALARIGGDLLLAAPGMIPGVAQVIGANESFYKTIDGFDVGSEDYRAMAELAVTEDFVKAWKANYDKYMLDIPVDMGKDYVKAITIGPLKQRARKILE